MDLLSFSTNLEAQADQLVSLIITDTDLKQQDDQVSFFLIKKP